MTAYFTTSTIKDWIIIFNRNDFIKIIIDSLIFFIENNKISLHGWIIMPNHIHLIFTIYNPFRIEDIFRDFHKFTSQQIIRILRNENNPMLVKFLSEKSDRKYQIWQDTHAPKIIETTHFFLQKLNYIHKNPCNKGWNLCTSPEEYPLSSAKDYILNQPGLIKIKKIYIY